MNDPLSVLASFLVSVAIAARIADASQAAMHALAKRKTLRADHGGIVKTADAPTSSSAGAGEVSEIRFGGREDRRLSAGRLHSSGVEAVALRDRRRSSG